jgi:hypothetical protein
LIEIEPSRALTSVRECRDIQKEPDMTPAHPPRTFSHGWSTGASSPLWATRCRRESPTTMMTKNAFKRTRSYASSKSDFLLRRLTSPGLIPGPTNSFPVTSATASASSPSLTGTLLRTNSMALSRSDSYARKFRTIRGFPSESKLVTRMFHPAGILGSMGRKCCSSMAPYSKPGRGFEHSDARAAHPMRA